MSFFFFFGAPPAHLGVKKDRLAPCPSTPNCVSSDATDSIHAIAPLELIVDPAIVWRALRAELESLPRIEIITMTDEYAHAECRSAFFGFVDDLELHLRAAQNIIAVRAASRLGHSDFRVNRKRVEDLRRLLQQRGVIR